MQPDVASRRTFLKQAAAAGATMLFVPKALVAPGDEEFEMVLPGNKAVSVERELTLWFDIAIAVHMKSRDKIISDINMVPGDTLTAYFAKDYAYPSNQYRERVGLGQWPSKLKVKGEISGDCT